MSDQRKTAIVTGASQGIGAASCRRSRSYQLSISSAQKRYLAAIKTLAVVRKLAVPVLQVNIARKQVNVAGSPSPF